MSAHLVLFLILLPLGVVAFVCGDTIREAVEHGEGWAIAALVSVMLTLLTIGSVLQSGA